MMKFKTLHEQAQPLLLCNVWDVGSTKVAEQLNFQAVGTSSAAMAKLLGYKDGEAMSFAELVYMVKRILANTNLPVSVDLESGYSRSPLVVAEHIKTLVDLGVVGINIEDSLMEDARTFIEVETFAQLLYEVNNQLAKDQVDVFLNVRTDAFLLGLSDAVDVAQKRSKLYENAGADGLFLPCIKQEADIQLLVASTTLPINVMCVPDLPSFEKLKTLGVRRISMGNFLFDRMQMDLKNALQKVVVKKSFASIC